MHRAQERGEAGWSRLPYVTAQSRCTLARSAGTRHFLRENRGLVHVESHRLAVDELLASLVGDRDREGVRTAKHVAQRERIPGSGQAVDPLAVVLKAD